MRLNLGCGTDIIPGFINLDIVKLDGVDVVHDLSKYPYPFEENTFDEIVAIDVIEHLPSTVQVIEELYRISSPNAKILVHVPYWNHRVGYGDITHLRVFDFESFDFFDPSTRQGKKRPYYSHARFKIEKIKYTLGFSFCGFKFGFKMHHHGFGRCVKELFKYFSNTISTLEFHLTAIK